MAVTTPIPQMFYLSDVLGRSVFDERGREVGKLRDMAALMGPRFPPISKLRVKAKGSTFLVPWSQVLGMQGSRLILRDPIPPPEVQLDERDLLLWRNVMDKQMVDLSGRKMLRVNDLTLATVGGQLCVTGVAIGFSAVLKRLGFLRAARWLPWFKGQVRDVVVPWDTVVPLNYEAPTVQLNVQLERLAKLHPADLARILSELSQEERSRILDSLDDERVADIMEEFEPREQAQMLESIDEERVPDVVGKMEPDDAADMLQELAPEEMQEILEHMEQEDAEQLKELLEHERDSAGGLMTSDFVAVPAGLSADEVLRLLRNQLPDLPAENVFTIFVLDEEGTLVGVTNLRDVLVAPPEARMNQVMTSNPVHAQVGDDESEAARLVARYDLLALPVLEDGRLVGIITVDDALDVLLPDDWKEYFPREH
jgi:magnesium transporter